MKPIPVQAADKGIGIEQASHGMKISSHLFDLRNAISWNGPIRPNRFLEEKKWPPRQMMTSVNTMSSLSLELNNDNNTDKRFRSDSNYHRISSNSFQHPQFGLDKVINQLALSHVFPLLKSSSFMSDDCLPTWFTSHQVSVKHTLHLIYFLGCDAVDNRASKGTKR